MIRPVTRVRIVGGNGDPVMVAENAARRAFPGAQVARADRVQDLFREDFVAGDEVLVFPQASPGELALAAAATDARNRLRWAIVVADPTPAPADSAVVNVTPADWNEPVVRQAMTLAVRLRGLLAASARLRGDVRTVVRRMGHDLRSPLNCILTASEAMVDPDDSPNSARSQLARSVGDAVEEVMKLFERVGYVLKASGPPPERQPVVMEEVVRGAIERFEIRLRKADITVTQPASWPIIDGVPTWLDVIWTNLLANSFVHAGPNGRIDLGWDALPDGHRFWIRDNGTAVEAGQAAHFFFPFERLSETSAPRGLGLPIVRRLVELHGGHCGYEPAVTGSGAFYFVVPKIAPNAAV